MLYAIINCKTLIAYIRAEDLGWKPSRTIPSDDSDIIEENPTNKDRPETSRQNIEGRRYIEEKLRKKIYVDHFGRQAGAILENADAEKSGYAAYAPHPNIYYPFGSEMDWNFGKWAKLRGPSSTAVTELLSIPGVSVYNYMM